jgi:acyl-CoA thioesterase
VTVDGPADTTPGACLEASTRLDGSAGHYTAHLSPAWRIWGPNGGYLATLALRAAGLCADLPHPAGIHATFLRSPRFDEVTIDVVTLKRGRRAEVFAVTMSQDGAAVLSFHPVATPSDWLLIDCEVQVGRVGRLGVAGRVWDVDGHLVATGSSQLCCVPTPT